MRPMRVKTLRRPTFSTHTGNVVSGAVVSVAGSCLVAALNASTAKQNLHMDHVKVKKYKSRQNKIINDASTVCVGHPDSGVSEPL